MAPKPGRYRLAFVFGMAVTILAVTAWTRPGWVAPTLPMEIIYRPQLALLF
jgi:hypothetical protein